MAAAVVFQVSLNPQWRKITIYIISQTQVLEAMMHVLSVCGVISNLLHVVAAFMSDSRGRFSSMQLTCSQHHESWAEPGVERRLVLRISHWEEIQDMWRRTFRSEWSCIGCFRRHYISWGCLRCERRRFHIELSSSKTRII